MLKSGLKQERFVPAEDVNRKCGGWVSDPVSLSTWDGAVVYNMEGCICMLCGGSDTEGGGRGVWDMVEC